MPGWDSAAVDCPSWRKRRTVSGKPTHFESRTLTATMRRRSSSSARHTVARPPSPSLPRIRYRPKRCPITVGLRPASEPDADGPIDHLGQAAELLAIDLEDPR